MAGIFTFIGWTGLVLGHLFLWVRNDDDEPEQADYASIQRALGGIVACPHCGQKNRVPAQSALVRCGKCHETWRS